MNTPEPCVAYKSILNSLSEGVCAVDLESTITCFNREAERLLGQSGDTVIGAPLWSVPPFDQKDWRSLVLEVAESGNTRRDIQSYVGNGKGERVPVAASVSPLRDAEGQLVGVVITLQDSRAIELLRRELLHEYTFGDIVSKDQRIQNILNILPNVAESESSVLILGPTGTGKELFARAIHNASPRKGGPFVAVNCGALPDALLESELFGYKKGAFTDAKYNKPGRFAMAKGGTLFLDEIGDISQAMQVRLLRVLQEKQYEPLGAVESETADVRIVAATNRELGAMVDAGEFRPDLYYRINVIEFSLPPLAERPGDVPLLVQHFVEMLNAEKGRNINRVSHAAMRWLMKHDFPGNVRELRNIIERAYVLCRHDEIREECFRPQLLGLTPSTSRPARRFETPLRRLQPEEQRQVIQDTLAEHGGHRERTAAALGIDKSTLWRKMKRLGIDGAKA